MSRYEYALIPFSDEDLYDEDIRELVANIFDICVNVACVDGEVAARAFISSGLAHELERKNAVYASGKSATDMVNQMLPFLGLAKAVEPVDRMIPSVDYWAGYMTAYFQMATGHPYKEIFRRFSYHEIAMSYWPLHEADDTKFLQVYQDQWAERFTRTHLAEFREREDLSQSELAARSRVSLRSIQMYEQGNKDINHASGETLYRLSLALGCRMEDLLER